jgi:hypothetical protein
MKNKWDEKTKFQVVLEGLRGKEVAEIVVSTAFIRHSIKRGT